MARRLWGNSTICRLRQHGHRSPELHLAIKTAHILVIKTHASMGDGTAHGPAMGGAVKTGGGAAFDRDPLITVMGVATEAVTMKGNPVATQRVVCPPAPPPARRSRDSPRRVDRSSRTPRSCRWGSPSRASPWPREKRASGCRSPGAADAAGPAIGTMCRFGLLRSSAGSDARASITESIEAACRSGKGSGRLIGSMDSR